MSSGIERFERPCLRLCQHCSSSAALPSHVHCLDCYIGLGGGTSISRLPLSDDFHFQNQTSELANAGLRPRDNGGSLMSRYMAHIRFRHFNYDEKERWQARSNAEHIFREKAQSDDETTLLELIIEDEIQEHRILNADLQELSDEDREYITNHFAPREVHRDEGGIRLYRDGDDPPNLACRYRLSVLYRETVLGVLRGHALEHVRELYYAEPGFEAIAAEERREYLQNVARFNAQARASGRLSSRTTRWRPYP